MSVEIENKPAYEMVLEHDNPILTHIIDRGDDKRSAEAIVLEARVMGTPVTALCGYTWVPARDPEKHPICQKCLEMFEFAKDFHEGGV